MRGLVSSEKRRRRGFQWPMVLALVVVWVLLWGELSIANVASGFAVAMFAVIVFPLPPISFEGRVRPLALAGLLGRFVADLVIASVQVAAQTLRFGRPPTNAIIQVDLRTRSDLHMTLTAELISLIPGSIVVEAHRASTTLFLHVLGVRGPADVERARNRALRQEARVLKALASTAELDDFHRKTQGAYR